MLTADDLSKFSSEWVEPISTTYRGLTVYDVPNGQGLGALEMLNLMEQFPLSSFKAGSADALHIMIEAEKNPGIRRCVALCLRS